MSELRDAIATAIDEADAQSPGLFAPPGEVAEAVLFTDEMQAIRKVLQRVAEFGIAVCDTDALMAEFYDLPDAIHDWVNVGEA